MIAHPAVSAKCTKAQIKAFELIAVNQTKGHHPKVIKALSEKGLIAFTIHSGSGRLGRFSWKEPFVPIPIHMQWCEWCAENVKSEEEAISP